MHERDGPSVGPAQAVLEIIDILRGRSASGGDGSDNCKRSVNINAEHDSLPDSEAKVIAKIIAAAYRGWSDAQRRSNW